MTSPVPQDGESRESFYAIRRSDGEPVDGEYLGWVTVADADDWQVALDYTEDLEEDSPVELEIVRMTVEPIAKRTFPETSRVG